MTRMHRLTFRSLRIALMACVTTGAIGLTGCSIDMPTYAHSERIQLATDNYSERFETTSVGSVQLDQIAEHYSRYGTGQAEVIISYDPRSKKNTAMKATDELHRISSELSKRGVKNLKGSIMAADGSGDISEMMVGYTTMTAEAPEGCDKMMPGYETSHVDIDPDYDLGCSLDTMIARQVARPADLAGRVPDPQDGDGRRAGAVVEPYREGNPNDALSGAMTTGN
jgi:pilus assembly protein CpaD